MASQPVNLIERGRAFVQSLLRVARRTEWEWRRFPYCGSTVTSKWGSYGRHPWHLDGRKTLVVPRHRCPDCGRTCSEEKAQVRRCAAESWLHLGCSRRRVAEWLRSWIGKQER